MEDKSLKKGLDALPFPQHYNADILDYETVQGKDGASFVNIKASITLPIRLESTGIVLPTEIRGVTKELALQSTDALLANASFLSSKIDCVDIKRLCGHVSASHAGTLYFQQSDDNTTWYNVSNTAITASTSATIDGVAYNSSISFDYSITARYARLIYVNGATAQTRFLISGYKVAL